MEKNESYFLIVDRKGNVAKIDCKSFSKFQSYCVDFNIKIFKEVILNQQQLKKPIIKDINKIISDYVHGKI